jgi:sugar transferase (PEP-CTERM/EpsH1 system associated)
MAQFVSETAAPAVPRILDFHDVDSEKFLDYARHHGGPRSLLYRMEARRLLQHDLRAQAKALACLFVSKDECDLFARLCPGAAGRLHVALNGVDCAYFDPGLVPDRRAPYPLILFTGRMDYLPNIDAAMWFAKDIFPAIRNKFPDVVFRIAGAAPAPSVQALTREPGIEVTGALPDMRPSYQEAWACVAPMRIARGIQNKVLEAMAMAKIMVATPAALEGLSAHAGEHVLCAADTQGFIGALLGVLEGSVCPLMGARARENVLLAHDWPSQYRRLDRIIDDVLAASRKIAADRPREHVGERQGQTAP